MKGILLLAWRYMLYNKAKTIILIACLTLTLLLPMAVNRLVQHYNEVLIARSDTTPLVVGAKGNRYDLVLKSLYFDTQYSETISTADLDTIEERGYGEAIPLHIRYTAHKFYPEDATDIPTVEDAPIVGSTLSYFEFRKLAIKEGSLPLFLGDAVVGSRAAERLGLVTGDSILSNPLSVYDPARSFQLKMPVVGVLEESGTADDDAVFVDVKTAWVIDGIGHGHQDLGEVDDPTVVDQRKSTATHVVGTAKVVEYQEVSDRNRNTFHFHETEQGFPLTAAILLPASDKMQTIAQGWYNVHETRDLLAPKAVVQELMGLVFKVKRFFDANFAVIVLTTVLFMGLVILLSFRLRQREMETLYKIGGARATVFWLQASEIGILLLISLSLAMLGSALLVRAAPFFIEILQT